MLIANPWTRLRELTAARIAIGRAGHSIPTRELLGFQLAHARARDAVWDPLDVAIFADLSPLLLQTRAHDRFTYLRRPDLGRRLTDASRGLLHPGNFDAALILADGLSAQALHRHARPFIEALTHRLTGWNLAPLTVVQQGRVAVGDEIGELLGAQLAVVIIGERPGLGSPDSLGVYLTWAPRVGCTDAERNCVSNIRSEGLKPEVAADRVAALMNSARQRQLTGVSNDLP
jgi:ethanolamine ammonia-lyase small subunit